MFVLESEIKRWREAMRAAGIGEGEIRDELEAHLREAHEAGVRSGLGEAMAFAAAVDRVGPGQALRREYEVVMPWWKRVWQLLRRPMAAFPTNMRFAAWCSLPVAAFLWFEASVMFSKFYPFHLTDPETGSEAVARIAFFLVAVVIAIWSTIAIGLLHAAISYLRKPAYGSARILALSWTVIVWFVACAMTTTYFQEYMLFGEPTAVRSAARVWIQGSIVVISVVAILSFIYWKRRLRMFVNAPPKLTRH